MEAATESLKPSAEVWRERITAQQAGGQSIRAWCRDSAVREHAFYWWRCRLGLSPATARKRRSRQDGRVAFAEVVVADAAAQRRPGVSSPPVASLADPILLRFAAGRELVLPMSMPARQIAALVRELEGAQ